MACSTHANHSHKHGSNCGHTAVQHNGHIDYIHDKHLHYLHDDHIDEHTLSEDSKNQSECTPEHACTSHDKTHQHGAHCGHEAVPHGDHIDFLVAGHLHHPCNNHCDHHGAIVVA
jgi:hypothetical protein